MVSDLVEHMLGIATYSQGEVDAEYAMIKLCLGTLENMNIP